MAQTYTILPGDNLINIARASGLSVALLMLANGITNPNQIVAGDTLTIPDPISGPTLTDAQREAIAGAQLYVGTHGLGDDTIQHFRDKGLTDDLINTLFSLTAKNKDDYEAAVAEQQAAYEAEQGDTPWWQGALRVGSALLNLPGHALWGGVRAITDDDYTAGDYLQGFIDGGKSTVASDVLAKGRDKDVLTGIMDVALAPTSMFAVGDTVRKYIPVANGYRKVGDTYIKVLGKGRADRAIRAAAKDGKMLLGVKGSAAKILNARDLAAAATKELEAFKSASPRQLAKMLQRADEAAILNYAAQHATVGQILTKNHKGRPLLATVQTKNPQFALGHDTLGYAAMVGGRRQMSGLSRTMDPLPLATYGVTDPTPFVIDRDAIPVNYYRQNLDVENYGSTDFQRAFAEARRLGLPAFEYNGLIISTDLAEGVPTRRVVSMPVATTDDYTAVAPEAAYAAANGLGIVNVGDVYIPQTDAGALSGDIVYMAE